MQRTSESFSGVQFLRFFAAMLVVITHATGAIAERMLDLGPGQYWKSGLAGVDIFFVISGFVMAVSSKKLVGQPDAWKIFLTKRIVRIVPLYWIATSAKILAAFAFAKHAIHSRLDLSYLLACYFFIPALNADNEVLPILTVGWTLTYEMFFYLVFALALALKVLPFRFVIAVFSVLACIGLFREPDWAPITVLASPIILEFAFGMGIAYLYMSGRSISPAVSALAILLGGFLLFIPESLPFKWRFIFWGIPAALIVGGFVFSEKWLGARLPAILTKLGDSSYSLYLFHPFAIPLIVVLMLKLGLDNPVFTLLVCIGVSLIVGVASYKIVELPVTRYIRALVKKYNG